MKFTIICDESSTDNRHLVIGALSLPRTNHSILIHEILEWKISEGLNPYSEFKWKKVSRKYFDKYKTLVSWFFNHLRSNHVGFRAIVVDTSHRLHRKYGNGDEETSFYKIYYHLLYQSIKRLEMTGNGDNVLILLDEKKNRYPFHKEVLKRTLNSAIRRDFKIQNAIANVEDRVSSGPKSEPLIQIVDIIIGAIGFVRNSFYNRPQASEWKRALVNHIEQEAKTQLKFDTLANTPFNIWTFDLDKVYLRKQYYKK